MLFLSEILYDLSTPHAVFFFILALSRNCDYLPLYCESSQIPYKYHHDTNFILCITVSLAIVTMLDTAQVLD